MIIAGAALGNELQVVVGVVAFAAVPVDFGTSDYGVSIDLCAFEGLPPIASQDVSGFSVAEVGSIFQDSDSSILWYVITYGIEVALLQYAAIVGCCTTRNLTGKRTFICGLAALYSACAEGVEDFTIGEISAYSAYINLTFTCPWPGIADRTGIITIFYSSTI